MASFDPPVALFKRGRNVGPPAGTEGVSSSPVTNLDNRPARVRRAPFTLRRHWPLALSLLAFWPIRVFIQSVTKSNQVDWVSPSNLAQRTRHVQTRRYHVHQLCNLTTAIQPPRQGRALLNRMISFRLIPVRCALPLPNIPSHTIHLWTPVA